MTKKKHRRHKNILRSEFFLRKRRQDLCRPILLSMFKTRGLFKKNPEIVMLSHQILDSGLCFKIPSNGLKFCLFHFCYLIFRDCNESFLILFGICCRVSPAARRIFFKIVLEKRTKNRQKNHTKTKVVSLEVIRLLLGLLFS